MIGAKTTPPFKAVWHQGYCLGVGGRREGVYPAARTKYAIADSFTTAWHVEYLPLRRAPKLSHFKGVWGGMLCLFKGARDQPPFIVWSVIMG